MTGSYSWDGADRLISTTVAGGSASYKYDADGRRVQQITSGGTTTNYLWDELSQYGDVVVEANTSNAVQTSYVLGQAELLSQSKISGGLSYFLKDGQGSTRHLTDNSGSLISNENYSYDAFGNLKAGPTSPATSYLYTAQQFDPLTSLYSLRARYYNPSDGRFFGRDTMQYLLYDTKDSNRYNYTGQNPINSSDPTGHFSVTYGLTLQNVAISALAGLTLYLGLQNRKYIAQIVSSVSIGFAEYLVGIAAAAFKTERERSHFAIAVGIGWVRGNAELFIAVSNFYYRRIANAWAELAEPLIRAIAPNHYKGGAFQIGVGKNVHHAEQNLVYLLRETSDLDSGQLVPAAVSKAICLLCQSRGDVNLVTPIGVLYEVDSKRDIQTFIASPGLQFASLE